MRADQCPKAIERFTESQRLDPSAAALINAAICYERLSKTAAAWRTFVQAVDAAVVEGNTELRSRAALGLSKLGPILTRVRIVTSKPVQAQTVLVNGEPVSDYRDPIPVDPGETVIEVAAPGRKPWRITVQAKRMGSVIVVEVPELAPVHTRTPSKVRPRSDLRPAALAVGGVGVVGLALGATWAVRAKSANDDANSQGNCTSNSCDPVAHNLREKAWDHARAATWATALGLTAVAAGTVLWFVSPRHQEKPQVGIAPWIDPKNGAGGLWLGGRL